MKLYRANVGAPNRSIISAITMCGQIAFQSFRKQRLEIRALKYRGDGSPRGVYSVARTAQFETFTDPGGHFLIVDDGDSRLLAERATLSRDGRCPFLQSSPSATDSTSRLRKKNHVSEVGGSYIVVRSPIMSVRRHRTSVSLNQMNGAVFTPEM